MNHKEGDYVEVSFDNSVKKGLIMPSLDKDILIIKLDSGYNLGIRMKKIKGIKILKKEVSEKEERLQSVKQTKGLRTVAILHTGGTIASEVDYETGAVKARFKPEELVNKFPEIEKLVNLKSRLIRNMFSEDMNFKHYNLLAKEIAKEIKDGADGVIVTHGTDTMHYSAAALSFILEDLEIPVVLTGAQRSSDRGSTDAALNLYCACKFIAESEFADVAICMHSGMSDDSCHILPGTKTRKLHTSRRDAFKAVNAKPWAIVSRSKIEFLRTDYKRRESRNFKLKLIDEKLKIGILKSHPNLTTDEIKFYDNFDGLIIEGTGLGHLPVNKIDEFTKNNEKILEEIRKLAKKIPVVMCSQCVFGRVDMNVYSTGRRLIEAGVLGNYNDMISETAFIKLAWLLSNHKKQVKELIEKNLRGEISRRLGTEFID